MLARVQIDHEIDEGAFQFCAGARETDKTAPAEFCRPLRIKKVEPCAERNVIDWLCESRFVTPTADHPICARILANWNTLMRQVRNLQKQAFFFCLSGRRSFVKIDNCFADFPNAGFKLCRRTATATFGADLFAQSPAVGIQLLPRRFKFPALIIDAERLVDFHLIAAPPSRKPLTDKIRFLA